VAKMGTGSINIKIAIFEPNICLKNWELGLITKRPSPNCVHRGGYQNLGIEKA
jgi:hypothetical protein